MAIQTKKEFQYLYPQAKKIYEIPRLHSEMLEDEPIEVYYVDKTDNPISDESIFRLFRDGEYVANDLRFVSSVKERDQQKIAQSMVETLYNASDFSELDRYVQGKCACREKEKQYSNCDDCDRYVGNEGCEILATLADSPALTHCYCLGYTYRIAHKVDLKNIEKIWDVLYGPQGSETKKQRIEDTINSLNALQKAFRGDSEGYIHSIYEILKEI